MPVQVLRPCRILLALALALVLGVGFALAAMPAAAAVAATGKSSARAASHHRRHGAIVPKPTAASAASTAACTDTNLIPTAANLNQIAASTLCLVNNERVLRGLRALRSDPAMAAAATGHSQDMVDHSYFDHVSPNGQGPLDRLRAAGYVRPNAGFTLGENIAAASGSLASPDATVRTWMNSPGHRANILNPAYRDSAIGVVAGAASLSADGATYTEEFGATS